MPRQADRQRFEEVMVGAYLLDILVEDHFSTYARPG